MASIRKRESSGKASYQVRWRVDGAEQTATFPTRAQAVKFRGMVEAAGNQLPPGWSPYAVPEPVETLTLAEWCAETIEARSGISERTRTDYARILDRHLGTLGALPIDEVTRNDIGRWVNSLSAGLSPKTVANVHGIVSSCLQDAVNALMIPKNHAKGIGLPRADLDGPRELIIYSASDFALIESHMDPYWLPLTETLKTTGMRWGEATALTPQWMNLMTQPSVKVVQAWRKMPGKGGGWEIGPPKTKRSVRSITITDALRDQLLPSVANKALDDFVFLTKRGQPVNHAHFYNLVWRPALFAAQSCDTHRKPKWQKGMPIPEPCGCPGTLTATPRIHDYRHFHASFLIDAGVPMMKISRRLGHESIQTTVDVYGHLLSTDDDEILAALGQPSRGPRQSVPAMPARPG